MVNSILLARPHPFIVADMKPFLERAGYTVSRIESLTDLSPTASNYSGAVISLAVHSSVDASAGEVFTKLRQVAPRIPVVFASLLPFAKVLRSLESMAEQAQMALHAVSVDAAHEHDPLLGEPTTFLYISVDDLVMERRRSIALRMIQQHCR